MTRISGFVDGVGGHAIHGWVANIDHPERLEWVVCHGRDGASLGFRAFLPRIDVCSALSLTGRFGFAIPTACLRPLGTRLRLTDATGALLPGGTIELPPPGRPSRKPAASVVLLHIQKTAGTSLRIAFESLLPPGELLSIYPDGFIGLTLDELGALPVVQRAALRLVVGHTFFGIGRYLPSPVDYVTVLRSPLARLRSHYRHHIAANSVFRIGADPLDTALVAQHALTDEFDNLMTRVLAGADRAAVPIRGITEHHVEAALHNIRTQFRFVALTERMDAHFPALCRAMGFSAGTHTLPPARTPADPPDPVDWEEAMRHNRFDAMLYARVAAEGLSGRDLRRGP